MSALVRFAPKLAVLLSVGLLTPSALAQPAPAEGGEKKELKGKNTFSLDQFETAVTGKAREIQERMEAIRQKKIASLQDILRSNQRYEKKPDILFRLAEALWESAKFKYLQAREEYDKKYTCFEEKRCTTEPEEPVEDYTVPINYYKEVLRTDPNYRRIDEVMYYLGRAALKAGKSRKDSQLQKEGVKYLNDMVQRHPKSRFIPKAHLALGEHFFETDSLFYAKTNYEKIINNFPKSPMFNYALYKLGWVYFNLAEFEKTVDTFKKVVSTLEGAKGQGVIEFRSQALNDLVVTWAEMDDGWKDARSYFMKQVGEEDTYKKLDKMAGLLVSKEKHDEAVDLYNHLIEHNKTGEKVVEYYDAILEVRRTLGDPNELENEINRVVTALDHKGAWFTANKTNGELTTRADDLVSGNLFFLANTYHRAAQKLDDQRKPAKTEYVKASDYYKMFLDRFPDHKDSYKLNFYYAEILYDQVGNFEEAAAQYEKVISKDKRGEFLEDAALGVIYAVEKLMVKEGLKSDAQGDVEYVTKKAEEEQDADKKVDLKDSDLKPIPRTELHDLERRYIAAADKYVELLSDALKDPEFRKKYPKRGKLIPNIMFIAAQTFYKHGQFKNAVERLMVIFDLYPQHKMANIAVNTIIDAYARLKRWEKIEEWARKLIRTKNFKVKTRAELEQMIAIAKTEHARDLTKQRKFDQAVRVQEEIVDEFGRKNKKLASAALYNIGVIHESARRFPEAVAAYEQVIKRYPKEEVAVKAQYDIGVLYESQTKFAEAAAAFIEMKRFKKNDKAADAIGNAAELYMALEDYEKANDTYELFVKMFPTNESVKVAAWQSALALQRAGEAGEGDPKLLTKAAKTYEKIGRKFGKKDAQFQLRALTAAGVALKKANKTKNRKKVTKLFKNVTKIWNKVASAATEDTKGHAATAALEMAEYKYDDYAKLKIEALNNRGKFDVRLLKNTLVAKAEALAAADKAFDNVLGFAHSGLAAAGAFRKGQILYEFAESLFNAPVPPQLTEEQVDEYRYQLEEVAAPIQEKALVAFTLALKQAVNKGVYNKWSRLSAEYAAKVNPDEFPVSEFNLAPNKTKDTIRSTSFIRIIRRGDTVVDFGK